MFASADGQSLSWPVDALQAGAHAVIVAYAARKRVEYWLDALEKNDAEPDGIQLIAIRADLEKALALLPGAKTEAAKQEHQLRLAE